MTSRESATISPLRLTVMRSPRRRSATRCSGCCWWPGDLLMSVAPFERPGPERQQLPFRPGQRKRLLLRLAELEHRLVREPAHARREHHLAVIVIRVGEQLALGDELETRRR